eukprot:3935846-Rhodomonas_salina.1
MTGAGTMLAMKGEAPIMPTMPKIPVAAICPSGIWSKDAIASLDTCWRGATSVSATSASQVGIS